MYQYMKDVWKGRQVHINATGLSFQRDEEHFPEAHYYDELAEEEDVVIVLLQGIPLPAWEDFKGNESHPDHFAHTSTRYPQPPKQRKPDKKRNSQNKMMLWKKYA